MNQERLLQVIMSPHITEKTSIAAEMNRQYGFKVAKDATKQEIKAAVEMAFEVKVEKVQVLNVKGKTKRFGRMQGKRKDTRKAYVTLQQGFDINFADIQA